LQRTNPGSNPLNLRGILFKRSGPALLSGVTKTVTYDKLNVRLYLTKQKVYMIKVRLRQAS
jgi:hypothetical protein